MGSKDKTGKVLGQLYYYQEHENPPQTTACSRNTFEDDIMNTHRRQLKTLDVLILKTYKYRYVILVHNYYVVKAISD